MTLDELALIIIAIFAVLADRAWADPLGWFTSVWHGDGAMTRVALVLVGNSLFLTMLALVFKIYANETINLTVDAISAWVILREPSRVIQGLIGFCYSIQIGLHLVFLATAHSNVTVHEYWTMLNKIGTVQMSLLLVWSSWNVALSGYSMWRRNWLVHHSSISKGRVS